MASASSTTPLPALLEQLLAIPSPTGAEAEAVSFMQEEARADGFRVMEDDAGNFIAEAGESGPVVWFVGHIDTVPGEIPVRWEGDELWGRGAVDAKGPLAAAYVAARDWIGRDGLRIRIIGCVDEEGHSRGAKALQHEAPPQWIINGEPSGSDGCTIGYKGIVRGTMQLRRPRTHTGHPSTGACEDLMAAWADAASRLHLGQGFEDIQARITRFDGGLDGTRDRAAMDIDIRIPPGRTPAEIDTLLREVSAAHDARWSCDERMPAAVTSARSPLASAFRAAIRAHGNVPRLKHKTGTSDLNHCHSWWPEVPMVAYGPGDSHLDHSPDERIHREELLAGADVLRHVFATLPETPALQVSAPPSN